MQGKGKAMCRLCNIETECFLSQCRSAGGGATCRSCKIDISCADVKTETLRWHGTCDTLDETLCKVRGGSIYRVCV